MSVIHSCIIPVVGVLPLSAQLYLRDHVAVFKRLDLRLAVSASALYLLAFSLVGLNDILGGTILAEGISITYPFPQKEFGEEVIRQIPLIELSRQSTVFLFGLLFVDSLLRLYFNHGRNQPMGFTGPIGVLSSVVAGFLGGNESRQRIALALMARTQENQAYKAQVASNREENHRRGAESYARFVKRRELEKCV